MDHIKLPRDINRLNILVPVLDKYAYDGAGFKTYPWRQGYTATRDEQICEASFEERPANDVASFIQAWLYFGLLREVLASDYREDRFISRTNHCVRTDELDTIILESLDFARWSKGPRWLPSWIQSLSGITLQQRKLHQENERICDLLDFAWLQCNLIDSFYAKWERTWWCPILLSVRLLIHRLRQACKYPKEGGVPLSAFPHPYALSNLPILAHIRQPMSGWCYHHFKALTSEVSCTTLYYLANLRRAPRVSHHPCEEQDHCVAYNVNEESFERAHRNGCHQCHDIDSLDINKMHRILEKGLIPVVECVRDEDSGRLTVDFVVAVPGASYTAISHLWADGLGNPKANSMLECQLEWLYGLVSEADDKLHVWHASSRVQNLKRLWTMSMKYAGLIIDRFLAWQCIDVGLRKQSRGKPIYFWLDVYCVPIDRGLDPRSRELKDIALNRMTTTYSWARYVLVLDNELRLVTGDIDWTEAVARIAVSGWNSRSWTYQEYAMSKNLAFQTHLGPLFMFDIGLNGVDGAAITPSNLFFSAIGLRLIDLANPLFRPRLATGASIRRDEEYSVKDRSENFSRVWNVLRKKTTTKREDAILIFAMLLDLNPAEVRALASNDRMRAITRTFSSLPLDFLFAELPAETNSADGGWTPSEPHGTFEIGRLGHFQIDEEARTLRIPFSSLVQNDCVPLTVLHISNLWNVDCYFDVRHEYLPHRYCMWPVADRTVNAQGNQAIILLDASRMDFLHMSLTRGHRNGACLVLGPRADNSETRVTSVCPILWRPAALDDSDLSKDEPIYAAEDFQVPAEGIVIDCDLFDWPNLHSRRDKLHVQRISREKKLNMLMRYISIIAFCFAVSGLVLFLNLELTGALDRLRGVSALPLIAVPFVASLALVANAMVAFSKEIYFYSISYATMAELSSTSTVKEMWWQILYRVLPKQNDRTVPGRWSLKLTIVLLRHLLRMFKAFRERQN